MKTLLTTSCSITCNLYVNIILNDYLPAILNLNQNTIDSNWKLDPRLNFDNVFDASGIPSGIGNQVNAEFNMIYRWHAATSNHDEAWVKGFMKIVFGPDVDPSKHFLICSVNVSAWINADVLTLQRCIDVAAIPRWFWKVGARSST